MTAKDNETLLASLIPYEWYEADAEIIAALDATNEARKAALTVIEALELKVGAKSTVFRGVHIAGLTFDGDAPVGWRSKGNIGHEHFYLPMKTSKALKAIRAEIDATKYVDMGTLSNMFGGSAVIGGDAAFSTGSFYRRGPICHKIGGATLFGVPRSYPSGKCTKDVSTLVALSFSQVAAMVEATLPAPPIISATPRA